MEFQVIFISTVIGNLFMHTIITQLTKQCTERQVDVRIIFLIEVNLYNFLQWMLDVVRRPISFHKHSPLKCMHQSTLVLTFTNSTAIETAEFPLFLSVNIIFRAFFHVHLFSVF
jgi:predicted metalloenzyme YecM